MERKCGVSLGCGSSAPSAGARAGTTTRLPQWVLDVFRGSILSSCAKSLGLKLCEPRQTVLSFNVSIICGKSRLFTSNSTWMRIRAINGALSRAHANLIISSRLSLFGSAQRWLFKLIFSMLFHSSFEITSTGASRAGSRAESRSCTSFRTFSSGSAFKILSRHISNFPVSNGCFSKSKSPAYSGLMEAGLPCARQASSPCFAQAGRP